ncbi:hypothetical protein ASE73_02365 [Sphingomonas sp. Leaf24]|uniref:hypothetical protein n=1 Tax=unclassified Sphingomonas TaxID=196159 RepID=UPI0006FA000C|nr:MULTISPECIES: hypothetical protein [unclassified Sphingomonas]KQM23086.1 hypothetical protein ASE50_02365 [Sphingomonas sp. Leaf5]KQM95944.1 hypothetical protein ASE73_02365 [Sphingomonas sp. Leaf24]
MIPPLTDLPTGFAGGEPLVAGVPMAATPTLRFADLLAVEPLPAAKIETQADRFNQDGFFGTSVAMPAAAVAAVLPMTSAEPVVEAPVASAVDAPAASSAAPVASAKPAAVVPALMPSTLAKPTAPQPIAPMPVTAFAAAPRPQSSRSAVAAPAQPRPPVRQRPVPTGSFVAVAVQAVAHGIEVVAQVAGLDDRDRAALADDVAALLAAHGYAPAHITITATSGTRQETR